MDLPSSKEDIASFLASHGVSLAEYGSLEVGLCRSNANFFLEILRKAKRTPLGIELWKRTANKISLDALNGWYTTSEDVKRNFEGAKQFLEEAGTDDELFTIQYR